MKKYYIRMLMVLLSLAVIMAVFNIAARFFAQAAAEEAPLGVCAVQLDA